MPPTSLDRDDEKALDCFVDLISKAWEMNAAHATDTEEEESYGAELQIQNSQTKETRME